MILSASQFKTYKRCKRLWWFDKVLKMPRSGGSYGHVFGKVIHAVAERWLLADSSGRNLEGERKEIYPDGWQTVEGETLMTEDEPVVKELIDMAIKEGMLARLPGRIIEKAFTVDLIPGVEVTGRIDLALPGEVQDHKSTVNMRYALSPKKLSEDTQMLLYAKIQTRDEKTHVTLRHNVFDRTNIRIRKTTVKVPVEPGLAENGKTSWEHPGVKAHWKDLMHLAADMRELKEAEYTEEDYLTVEPNMPEGCNMYGGCRFIGVCTKRETPEHYRIRYERLQGQT